MHGGMSEELWLSDAEERRLQAELQERIWDELHRLSDIDTGDVLVWVENSVATLSGSVTSLQARIVVEQALERVPGLLGIVTALSVVSSQAGRGAAPAELGRDR